MKKTAACAIFLGLLTMPAAPALASRGDGRDDRPPCEREQRRDERPRCWCDRHDRWEDERDYYRHDYDDDKYERANTPTTSTTVTTAPKVAETTTTTAATVIVPPAVMIHEDPTPEVKGIAVDRTAVSKPEPLRELPKTGGAAGTALAGILMTLGGVGVACGRKKQ